MQNQGRRDEAERVYGEMLAIARRVLGPRLHDTLWALSNIAGHAAAGGRYSEALGYLWEAVTHGFAGTDFLLQNSDFDAMRDDAEFQEIVAASRANAASE